MDTLSFLGKSQQILLRHLLYEREGLTLTQLEKLLDISRNAAAQHISALEGQGFIESRMLKSGGSGGRPSRTFTLTNKGVNLFPKQYALFSSMLLQTINATLSQDDLDSILISIGKEFAETFKNRVDSSRDKVNEVRVIMQEMGYETQAPPKLGSQEIILKNCIYHDLAMNNSNICQLDQALMAALLGPNVEQKKCMALGDNSCIFCIKE